jgi:Plant transposon protein
MLGSLDYMHVAWRTCRVAWQGAFQGKEKSPTIVVEVFAEYQLWIWHAAFGFAGSVNGISIWDQSPLCSLFVDGSFSENVDFKFEINGKEFKKLWLLVDGIYPQCSRFVKTLEEALLSLMHYVQWQETARKDIEHAFRVLQ